MEEIEYPILDVGDVAYIFHGGYGFIDENEKLYCVVEEYSETGYFGSHGYLVSKYEHDLVDHDYDNHWVGVESFGENPLILFNINDEHVADEEHTVVAEGSKKEVDGALGINRSVKQDMVNKPSHYQLFHKDEIEGDFIEVKHVVKAVLQSWQEQDKISFDFYQAGCYKELLQYLLRAPLKNNIEDVQKAEYYLKEIINEW